MAQYYIITDEGIVYEMDATTDTAYTLTGKTTDSPIEDGESVSDHYVQNPTTVNFTGVITDVISLSSNENKLDTEGFINGLIRLKNSKRTFTVFNTEGLEGVTNCLFTSLSIMNGGKHTVKVLPDQLLSSFKISWSVKQIRKAVGAETIRVTQPALKDTTQPKVESAQATKSEEPGFFKQLLIAVNPTRVINPTTPPP